MISFCITWQRIIHYAESATTLGPCILSSRIRCSNISMGISPVEFVEVVSQAHHQHSQVGVSYNPNLENANFFFHYELTAHFRKQMMLIVTYG